MIDLLEPIYLDYAATTPVDPRVIECMMSCLGRHGAFGNPASRHVYGERARAQIEFAREHVAALIQAQPSELIFTSGATESINMAIKGAARLYQRRGKHIVTVRTEHKAVLDVCMHLEKEGYQVTYLTPEANGLLTVDALLAALRPDTILVSIMHVNNETGIIQNIAALAELTAARGILLHVDAAQSMGKVDINVFKTPIDLLSLGAHKVYGPKGIGALYLRKKPRVRVEPILHGGGHEQGMRSGTMPTHQIVGLGEACRLAQQEMRQDTARVIECRDAILGQLTGILNLRMNSDLIYCVPHILNMRFEGMLADAILEKTPAIAASTASACQGKGTEGSYVLRAMGFTEEQAKSSIRLSFGRFTTKNDAENAGKAIAAVFFG